MPTEVPDGMVLVPGGPFYFLNTPDGYGLTKYPGNPARLDSFYIDITEVTNSQYAEFLNSGNEEFYHDDMNISRDSMGIFKSDFGMEEHPVVSVSYNGANAFARWAGKRLPTEMEWEKAARGSAGGEDENAIGFGYMFPWGNSEPDSLIANFINGAPYGYPETTPVGYYDGEIHDGFPTEDNSSIYGAYDMAGNVWEWTSGKLIPFAGETVPDDVIELRVVRGGSFKDAAMSLRTTTRSGYSDSTHMHNIGFRCVKDLR
ncbi:MAG: SUMF1/EgtB/PvdO family nonheme iron enzyme [candidate division Zixibacteria bacterium]|nr:SUMF1/EgtB/PvdO family nonheme iron enzyme [candidate division Zixibacteria bacterium]